MSQRKDSVTPVNSAAAAARIMSGSSSGTSSGGIPPPPPPLSRLPPPPPPRPPPMTGGRGNAGRSYMGYKNDNKIGYNGGRQGRGGRVGRGGGGGGNNNNYSNQQQQIQQLMAGGQHHQQQQQQDGSYYGNNNNMIGGQQQQQGGRGGRGRGGNRHNNNNNSYSNNGSRGRGREGRGGRGNGGGRGGGRGRGRGDTNLKYDSSQYDRIEEINGVGVTPSDSSKDGNDNDNDIVRIAIEGCCHGELDLIYDRLLDHEKQTNTKIDLLLCCGDFQSLRNELDFQSSSIPTKYQKLGTFCQYYSGQKKAPILTIFIGGNHEASQSLRELYYGGYVAPNIYFMGAAASIKYRGIRIGGLSGIYKSFDYTQGHHERIPYDYKSNKSVYHTRNVDIERMKLLKSSSTSQEDKKKLLDIVLSHDWPLGIEQHGNTQALIRKKPFFRQEIQNNDLGSTPNREVLDTLQPKYWFAAHLHVKFHATVIHKNNNNNNDDRKKSTMKPTSSLLMPSQATTATSTTTKKKINDDNDNGFIAFDENHADDTAPEPPSTTPVTEFHAIESNTNKCTGDGNSSILDLTEQMTKFLALDKCLPRRQFLSILNLKVPVVSVPEQQPPQNSEGKEKEIEIKEKEDNKNRNKNKKEYHIEYDPEWLAILKKTHHWNSTQRQRVYIPSNTEPVNDNEIEWVIQRFKDAASVAAAAADSNDTLSPSSTSTSFLEIPYNDFVPTVPYNTDIMFTGGGSRNNNNLRPLPMMGNPQTDRLLNILDLNHILTIPYDPITHTPSYISNMYQGIKQQPITTQTKNNNSSNVNTPDSNEIDLDDLDDDDDNDVNAVVVAAVVVDDDNEINIDDDEDEDEDDALVVAVAIDDDDNDDDANAVVVAVAVYNNNNSDDDDNNDDDNEIDIDDDDDGDDDETMAKVTIKKARIEE